MLLRGRRCLLGSTLIALVVTTGCSSGPSEIPNAIDFSLPSLDVAAIGQTCNFSDRVGESQCLVETYLPVLNAVFEPVVTSRGREFTPPAVELDSKGAETRCGLLTSPAYCPSDQTLVIPLDKVSNLGNRAPDAALERVLFNPAVRDYFTRELTPEELTAGGSYAAVIATAHEYAHHVQNLIGSLAVYQSQDGSDPIAISRRIELEADCLTGWVSGYLNKIEAHVPATIDNWAAATTLTEIGDDFIDPSIGEGGHGTVEQRVAAWQEGLIAGIQLTEPYGACMTITDQVLAGRTGGQAPSE